MFSEIQIEVRSIYGNDTYYPLNNLALDIAKIAGTKTLTTHMLRILLGMGFPIKVYKFIKPNVVPLYDLTEANL